MTISRYEQISDNHIDILKELGNIGAGNAATSLAQMLSQKVNTSVPEVMLMDINEAIEMLGGPESIVLGILAKIREDIDGIIIFMLKREFVSLVVNSLLGTNIDNFEDISEMELSAIQEIGNIMIASYVNSIASLTGLTIDISVPALTVDMAGAIMNIVTMQFDDTADKVVFIREKFTGESNDVSSHVLLIPNVDSLGVLMKKLGLDL